MAEIAVVNNHALFSFLKKLNVKYLLHIIFLI